MDSYYRALLMQGGLLGVLLLLLILAALSL